MSSKRTKITGYDFASTEKTLMKMRSHQVMGDWCRDRQIRIPYKICTIIWTYSERNMAPHKVTALVPIVMTGLMVKNQTASGRSWNSFPDSVKKHFDLLDEKMFSYDKFTVEVLFSGANHTKINYSTGTQTPIYIG